MAEKDERETTLAERSRRRREHMEMHVATGFEDAERWDLEFWQRRTPQERLSALAAIHRDIAAIGRPETRPRGEE